MPGIVGLITKMPRLEAEVQLRRMVGTLRHESFYETGTWIDESLGVYVGWAVPQDSFSGGMPLHNDRGDVSLVFSGEDYPEPGTRSRLKERGYGVDAHPAAYLIHLYQDDPTFPACLNGRFHGLLIDRVLETTTLFNDRFGMHRIYYHEAKTAFYFAAEAKSILEVQPELRKANLQGLGELITCGSVLENRTLFEGIHVLPPATAWLFRNATSERKRTYFRPDDWENQETLEPEPYYRELREVFSGCLPRYFEGHARIGMSLTGGLDSRMIMAWLRPPQRSLACYSFGSSVRDSRDVRLARRVARTCGQSHHVIRVGDEFLRRFPQYAERSVYLTDGCTGVEHAADLYVNEQARKIAPVRMTGNYGGEVFRRVRAFKPVQPLAGLFRQELAPYIRQAGETYATLLRRCGRGKPARRSCGEAGGGEPLRGCTGYAPAWSRCYLPTLQGCMP